MKPSTRQLIRSLGPLVGVVSAACVVLGHKHNEPSAIAVGIVVSVVWFYGLFKAAEYEE